MHRGKIIDIHKFNIILQLGNENLNDRQIVSVVAMDNINRNKKFTLCSCVCNGVYDGLPNSSEFRQRRNHSCDIKSSRGCTNNTVVLNSKPSSLFEVTRYDNERLKTIARSMHHILDISENKPDQHLDDINYNKPILFNLNMISNELCHSKAEDDSESLKFKISLKHQVKMDKFVGKSHDQYFDEHLEKMKEHELHLKGLHIAIICQSKYFSATQKTIKEVRLRMRRRAEDRRKQYVESSSDTEN